MSAGIDVFISSMEVNRMYELPNNPNFKWAMIEYNEFGFCWTIGYKGLCTTIYSMDTSNNIKYWRREHDAKSDLIKMLYK